MLGNPFEVEGQWCKSALHVHTTDSDGKFGPRETVQFYAQRGYGCVCLTDHDGSEQLPEGIDGVLTLPGMELSCVAGKTYHLVGLGLDRPVKAASGERSLQQGVKIIKSAGGEIFLAHPYWSGLGTEDVQAVPTMLGVEVYNTVCDFCAARGYNEVYWDYLLDRGHVAWAIAADDCHFTPAGAGDAWTMLKLAQPTREAFLESLRNGWFYSSTGVNVHQLQVDDRQVRIVCDPVRRIDFVIAPSQAACFWPTETLHITEAVWQSPDDFTGHVRIQCLAAGGQRAWTNPFFWREGRLVSVAPGSAAG